MDHLTLRAAVRACGLGPGRDAFLQFCRRARYGGQRVELSVKRVTDKPGGRVRLIWGGDPTAEAVAASCSLFAEIGIRPHERALIMAMMEAATSQQASRIMVACGGRERDEPRLKFYVSLGRGTTRAYAYWRALLPCLPPKPPARVMRMMVACSLGRGRAHDRAYLFFRPSALRSTSASWWRATLGGAGVAVARRHTSFALGFKQDGCDMLSLRARHPSFADRDGASQDPLYSEVMKLHGASVPWLPDPVRRLTWVGIPFPQVGKIEETPPGELNAYWDVSDLFRA